MKIETPTPRTDEAVRLSKVISSAFGPMVGADDMEKLERELSEARLRYEVLLLNYNADTISLVASERDQLRKELAESQSWVKPSMESATIAASAIAQLTRERDEARLLLDEDTRNVIVENDWLRKMVDAFAECDCGDEWLMADYRELPHVRARKAK